MTGINRTQVLRTLGLLLCIVTFFSALKVSSQVPSQKQMTAEFDKLLMQQFKPVETGCAALVAIKGQIVYKKAFGMADLELNVPMQPDMVFRIGSITKQFTAVAILQLMEQGKLSLQDEITKFIPDYPTQAYKITVEHLLTHTSGIKSFTNVPEYAKMQKEDVTPENAIKTFRTQPMEFAPGTKWNYNNSGYFLLGYIIEKVSGKTYREYIEENLFKPAGMTNSLYGDDSRIVKNRARGYQSSADVVVNADYLNMTVPYSAGALMSTVEDLFKWNQALHSYKLVKKETLDKAFTEYKLSDGKGTSYGFGWFFAKIQGSPTIEHGGGINGYLTNGIYLPNEDVFVAVFSNNTAKGPDLASNKMAAIAIGKPFILNEIPVDTISLNEYNGVYENEEGKQRMIFREGKQLFSQRSGSGRIGIKPYKKDMFFFENSVSLLTFNRDGNGNIVECVSDERGTVITWKKTNKPLITRTEVTLEASLLTKYTGEYELNPGFILTFTADGNHLFTQATGQPKFEVFAESETKFFLKVVDAQVEFIVDNSGKVNKLILNQGGQTMEAKRVK